MLYIHIVYSKAPTAQQQAIIRLGVTDYHRDPNEQLPDNLESG